MLKTVSVLEIFFFLSRLVTKPYDKKAEKLVWRYMLKKLGFFYTKNVNVIHFIAPLPHSTQG